MPKHDDVLKRLRKELAEANEIIAQQQHNIDRYQEQWNDYEAAKADLEAARAALELYQDYIFMLLEFLRAMFPEVPETITANFDKQARTWKVRI